MYKGKKGNGTSAARPLNDDLLNEYKGNRRKYERPKRKSRHVRRTPEKQSGVSAQHGDEATSLSPEGKDEHRRTGSSKKRSKPPSKGKNKGRNISQCGRNDKRSAGGKF